MNRDSIDKCDFAVTLKNTSQTEVTINDNHHEKQVNKQENSFKDLIKERIVGSSLGLNKLIKKQFDTIDDNLVKVSIMADIVSSNSTTGLIMNDRPASIPPKTPKELEYHMKLTAKYFDEVRKDQDEHITKLVIEKNKQLKKEQEISDCIHFWKHKILPNWDDIWNDQQTLSMWWKGVPPCVRAQVWRLSIGNDLKITPSMIEMMLNEAEYQLKLYDTNKSELNDNIIQKRIYDLIKAIDLDVVRTFPQLNIFQIVGPLHNHIRALLLAYGCFRIDLGYVQGMSFLMAILLLNLEIRDAFVVFCNMMNGIIRLSLFTLKEEVLNTLFAAFGALLKHELPELYSHFNDIGLSSNMFLIDWLLTIFSRLFPLETASRILDLYFRDGEAFLFRCALGYLKLYQDRLLDMDEFTAAEFLTNKKNEIDTNLLFESIGSFRSPNKWMKKLRKAFTKLLEL